MKTITRIEERKIPKTFLKYLPKRDSYILERCKDKRVLHIGASDWPYTQEQLRKGVLLYERIGAVAAEQLGVDLAKEASIFLNNKNIPNSRIVVGDMNELQTLDFHPDIIIFGDTLEHLMNLEIALSNVKKVMGVDTQLIISVPNAFFILNFVYALIRKEHQHPDHNVTFTYKTLTQLLKKNKLIVKDFRFTFLDASSQISYLNWKGRIMYFVVRLFTRISPVYAETLLVTVKRK